MKIHKKIMQARMMLQELNLKKSGHNKFAGYKYFELSDFLPSVQNIFDKLGLCSIVSFTNEYATLTIIDVDDDSQITFTSPMAEANLKGTHPIQNLGAVETYSRRYLYVTALEIVEHDAIDASEPVVEKSSNKSVSKDVFDRMSAEDKEQILSYAMEVNALSLKNDIEGAIDYINELQLDADWKTALWSQLDSKIRSAIKKFTTR